MEYREYKLLGIMLMVFFCSQLEEVVVPQVWSTVESPKVICLEFLISALKAHRQCTDLVGMSLPILVQIF